MGTEITLEMVFNTVSVLIGSAIHFILLKISRFLGCLGAASGNPIQSYLFASILSVTQLIDPQALIKAANLEALKFFILAIGVAVAYYLLGFSSTSLATVSLS